MPLNRSLGLTMLTFYGTGMILGAGVYSIIGQAAGKAGDGLWQGFVLAAMAAFLTALSYAELAAMFPKAGGEYLYLRHAFPNQKWIAATTGIIITFAGSASAATVATAFASYLQYFVELPPFWVASGLLVFFSGINLIGIKESSWVNAVFTLIEIFGLVLFIWLGWQNPKFGSALSSTPTLATLSSAALIIFAYFGFENIVSLSEETLKVPVLPVLGIGICSVFLFQFDLLIYSIGAIAFVGSAGVYFLYTYYFRGGELE